MDNIHGEYDIKDDETLVGIHEGFEMGDAIEDVHETKSSTVAEYNANNPHGYRLDESMGDIGFKYLHPLLDNNINESGRPGVEMLVESGVYHKVLPTELLLENRRMTDEEKDLTVESITNMHRTSISL